VRTHATQPPPPSIDGTSVNASKSRGRALACCFTLNNYTPEEVAGIRNDNEHYKWLCYGEEKGASGTPHLQGIYDRSVTANPDLQ